MLSTALRRLAAMVPARTLAIMSDVRRNRKSNLRQRLGEMYKNARNTPATAKSRGRGKGKRSQADTEKAEEKPTAGPKTAAKEEPKPAPKPTTAADLSKAVEEEVQDGEPQAPKPEPADEKKKKRERPITEVWRRVQEMGGERPGRRVPNLSFVNPEIKKAENVAMFGKGGKSLDGKMEAAPVKMVGWKEQPEKSKMEQIEEQRNKRARDDTEEGRARLAKIEKMPKEVKRNLKKKQGKGKRINTKPKTGTSAIDVTNTLIPQSPKLGPMEVLLSFITTI